MTFRPYVPLRGVLGGALAGLGMFVLMQQFAIVAPTRSTAIAAVAGGAVVMLVAANGLRAVAGGRRPAPVQPRPAAVVAPSTPGFRPTHRAPASGLDAYEAPGNATTVARLDPGLEVEVIERTGDWTHVRCSNGWTTWVDGRLLVDR